MHKKILNKMPANVKKIYNFIIWFCAILFVAGLIVMACDMAYFDITFFVGIGIAGLSIPLLIDLWISVYFYGVAFEKGHTDSIYLIMPFLFTFCGYVLICALPDRRGTIMKSTPIQENSYETSYETPVATNPVKETKKENEFLKKFSEKLQKFSPFIAGALFVLSAAFFFYLQSSFFYWPFLLFGLSAILLAIALFIRKRTFITIASILYMIVCMLIMRDISSVLCIITTLAMIVISLIPKAKSIHNKVITKIWWLPGVLLSILALPLADTLYYILHYILDGNILFLFVQLVTFIILPIPFIFLGNYLFAKSAEPTLPADENIPQE